MFFLHLPLEHDLQSQPAQEEHQLGQRDQREAAEHRQPAADRAWNDKISLGFVLSLTNLQTTSDIK